MKSLLVIAYAWLFDRVKTLLMLSNITHKMLFVKGFSEIRIFTGKAKAYREFINAKRTVPAYSDFLKNNNFSSPSFKGLTPNLHEIPITDKENYVKLNCLDQRCVKGQIAQTGVIIDESSGSSGMANNWARGLRERETNAVMIKFGMQNLFGKGSVFIINAFALGAWATGVNITLSCVKFAKIKSTGPDPLKIKNTLNYFGKQHKYIIMGYPPFLKSLVDEANIDWSGVDVSFIFGGESMAEEMRDYLISKGISKIYSSLGASDLELNMAAENDFTISLRRLLRKNASLRADILKYTGALPMIFQYNPADFFIEVSDHGELIFTVCRPGYLAPKIRYNLHDKGHIMSMNELLEVLRKYNIKPEGLIKPTTDLPMLFHYGRADMTISFFGANVSPNDIQEAIYRFALLRSTVYSFHLNIHESYKGDKRFVVSLEMQKGKYKIDDVVEDLENKFFEELANVNQDFREAKRMLTDSKQLSLVFFPFGEGPFRDADIRIKSKYLS